MQQGSDPLIIQLDDWVFDVDIAATMEYSAAEAADHCTCAYCRNFYAAIDAAYPRLRAFLAQFGLDIEAPDELMPYDVNAEMHYDGCYAVSGRIISKGIGPIILDDVQVTPYMNGALGPYINHSCPAPAFILDIGTMQLPWILDEPMEETVSPANQPSFLKRMWERLLVRLSDSDITS